MRKCQMSISQNITIKTGDILTVNQTATDYHVRENQKYQVLDFDGECIQIMSDTGETVWLPREYFVELQ